MTQDFKNWPELTNNQLQFYYLESPHRQITENFDAKVVRVIDGDTIKVRWDERDFNFPVRFADTSAAETDEVGGNRAKEHLESMIKDAEITVEINPKNRVGKFGRILGTVIHEGINVNQQMIDDGFSSKFGEESEGAIPDFFKEIEEAI